MCWGAMQRWGKKSTVRCVQCHCYCRPFAAPRAPQVTVYAMSHLLRGSMEQRVLLNSITSLVLLGRAESYLGE